MLNHMTGRTIAKKQTASAEFSRILSAAVINRSFRKMLLADPLKAIASGYSGEKFDINNNQKNKLAAIRANSLADFALQLSNI